MDFKSITPPKSIAPFVKNIMIFQEKELNEHTSLPFFADGFPGLVYQNSSNGIKVFPHNKLLPPFFLYGQTIQPTRLEVTGRFEMIIFQLYPFTIKQLFELDPVSINDDCYDLTCINEFNIERMPENLMLSNEIEDKIQLISGAFQTLLNRKETHFDPVVKRAVILIISSDGRIIINKMAEKLRVSTRTLVRKFQVETGLSPKQFARIIQFQNSLTQLNKKEYSVLTDIVYKNGYSDQSHFIRVFKEFTTKTPKQFARGMVQL